MNPDHSSKLDYEGIRVDVQGDYTEQLITEILSGLECPKSIASQVAHHLVDTSLCGIESHGVMRTLQYGE